MNNDHDEEMPVADVTGPPARAALRNPLVAVVVIVFAISLVTVGLVAANGDDFAKARLAVRPRLPVPSALAFGSPRRVEVPTALGDPGPTAVGYELKPATRDQVANLAEGLGMGGEVVTVGGEFRVTKGDRVLLVSDNAGSSFRLFSRLIDPCAGSTPGPECQGLAPGDPEAAATNDFAAPPDTAPGVNGDGGVVGPNTGPVGAKAVARAAAVSAVFGARAGFPVVTAGGHHSWSVHIPLRAGALSAHGWEVDLGVNAAGEVRSARGWLGDEVKVGSYPLVGVEAGIQRLRDGQAGSQDRGVQAAPPPGVCRSDSLGRQACTQVLEPRVPPFDSGSDPLPEPPPLNVTGVRLGLHLASGRDGQFLVPAYVFTTTDASELAVPAITDEDSAVIESDSVVPLRRSGGPLRTNTNQTATSSP